MLPQTGTWGCDDGADSSRLARDWRQLPPELVASFRWTKAFSNPHKPKASGRDPLSKSIGTEC